MKQLCKQYKGNLIIAATKPAVPFSNISEMLEHPVTYVEENINITEIVNIFGSVDLLIMTGWVHKNWLKYAKFIKKCGGKVIVSLDNRFRGDHRQLIGRYYYQLFLRNIFDGCFVPGLSSTRLMSHFNVNPDKIYTKYYGAYEEIYNYKDEIKENRFIFVGQFIERKGIDVMCSAYRSYRRNGGTWKLLAIGQGEMAGELNKAGADVLPFQQPENVAAVLKMSKCLILMSRDDNWATVVCEAAACGCHIICSTNVGAADDIVLDGENGRILDAYSTKSLTRAMHDYENMKNDKFLNGMNISLNVSKNFNSFAFASSVRQIIKDFSLD